MKTLLFTMLITMPFMALSQIHLPGAKLSHIRSNSPATKLDSAFLKTYNFKIGDLPDDKASNAASANTSGVNVYKAAVLTTNFTLPMVRVNLLDNNPPNATNAKVNTSFFNSIGAGLNLSWGELKETLDDQGNSASVDFSNDIGIELGALFAANTGSGKTDGSDKGSQPNTIFAVMAGLSVLNFQVGIGHEFGSLPEGQKRTFFTLSYSIPLSTLINGGYHIFTPRLK